MSFLDTLSNVYPCPQVYVGVEVVRSSRVEDPFHVALTADATVAGWWGPGPIVGGFARAQLGPAGRRYVAGGARVGASAMTFISNVGYFDTFSLNMEIGRAWGLGRAEGDPNPPPLHGGTIYLAGAMRGGRMIPLDVRVARLFDTGSFDMPRFTSVGAGLSVATVPVWYDGRPLRTGGGWWMPRVSGAPSPWTTAAAQEAGAIGAFLRLAAELAAVGAPPALIRRALDAASDEVHHTAICLDRAGARCGPIPLALPRVGDRTRRLTRLGVEGIVDGLHGEGAAARRAWAAAAAARDDGLARDHERIAADEDRHAALGADIAAWAAREGGAVVRRAVRSAEAGRVANEQAPPREGCAGPP